MARKSYVYLVQRRDLAHWEDEETQLGIISVHASLKAANATAKAHYLEECEGMEGDNLEQDYYGPDSEDEEVEEDDEDGEDDKACWSAHCRTFEDDRDSYDVEVVQMELEDVDSVFSSLTPKQPPTASRPSMPVHMPQNTIQDFQTMPGTLAQLNIVFTGNLSTVDRDTAIVLAHRCGATVQPAPTSGTQFVVVGAAAPGNKLVAIEQNRIPVMNETQFLHALRYGIPRPLGRSADGAAYADVGPSSKRQRV